MTRRGRAAQSEARNFEQAQARMKQIARNATMDDCDALRDCRYLLHDRDTKFTRSDFCNNIGLERTRRMRERG
jgi:hypothetical protein